MARPPDCCLLTQARVRIANGETAREAAVHTIDAMYGFTCEFSSFPAQHVAEYDELEATLEGRS